MNELAREVAREQEVLDRALARLEVLRHEAVARERDSLDLAQAGTPQGLYERDVQVLAAAVRRSDLDAAGEGLVFGRLDLQEGTPLHVGRIGLRTEDQEPIVVDWRAPAAAAFYQATSAEPLGVVRRRTITSRQDRVVGVDDELLDPGATLEGTVVGDGAFLAAVSRERGPHMRDIVATIQREQDVAVRAPDDGALVVTGGPGTGKTAVALHRVAYLMYARRDWYGRRGVLVVGPSDVFVDYISAVLPSLGETSVRLSSLAGVPTLPRELVLGGDDDPAAAVVKGSSRMAALLKRAARHLAGAERLRDLELERWGHAFVVPVQEQLHRRSQVGRSPRSHNAGHTAYVNALVEAAWRLWERRPHAGQPEPGDREDFGRWLKQEPRFVSAVAAAWPALRATDVLEALSLGRVPLSKVAKGLYDEAEQRVLAGSWPSRTESGTVLSAADVAVVDELEALLGPVPEPEPDPDDSWDELAELEALAAEQGVTTFADRNRAARQGLEQDHRTFAHVVVDEAQDVSPMQWRMLGRRARGATWTIVGDWAQSAWPDVQEVRSALDAVVGTARVRAAVLSTNYRTSTEIAELAARVLHRIDPAAVPPAAVRATGVEPEWSVAADLVAAVGPAVDALLDQVGGTVGVVVPRALRAAVRHEDPRVSVVDPWQVKGLEYDGCVVVAPELVVAEALTEVAGLRTLYVALSRATQRLVVLSQHPVSWLQ
ncbi:MAG TPA: UvrD-helicase domain-containing protein [Mycobacteriales bacterium]|nr:UvrD-helicase domain-containing protein [Mycobacteriales bacterium]